MIESVLQRQLAPIVEREERIRRSRGRVIVFLVVAVLSLLGIGSMRGTGEFSAMWLLGPLVAGAIAVVIHKLACRRPAIDVHAVARRIEANNPELEALLVTAVEQEDQTGGKKLSFLQERVVHDAAQEAIAAGWRDTQAGRRRRGWRLGERLAAAAMVMAWLLLAFSMTRPGGPEGDGSRAPALLGDTGGEWDLEVTPGDVEVERDSKLIVTARFGDRVPTGAKLEATLGEVVRTIPMARNLADPVFVAAIPRADADGTYRITFAGDASRDFSVTTFLLPAVERIDAAIEPPGGSDLSAKLVKDTRRITILEGSTVRLQVRTNAAARAGRVTDGKQGLDVALTPSAEDEGVMLVELAPGQDTDLRVHLTDAEGRANRRPPLFRIKVKRNLPPQIALGFPGQDAAVTPLQELAVEAKVWDDVRIVAAGATYQFGSEAREVTFDTGGFEADKRHLVSTLLDFEELGAQPNDLLTYFFWAEDTGPDGTTRRVQSDLRFAEVRHFEEIFREAPGGGESESSPEGQGNQSEKLLEMQKEVLNATWKLMRMAEKTPAQIVDDAPVLDAGQRAVMEMAAEAAGLVGDSELTMHLEAALAAMEAATERLGAIEDEDDAPELHAALGHEQEAYAALLRLRAREFQIQRSSQQSSSSSASQRQQRQMMNMELKEEEKRYETQRYADQQQQEQQRTANREDLQMLNRLKELARRQGGLTEKIKELQAMLEEAETEEEKEEIRRELERLEEEQREMLADLDELNERMENEENRSRTAEDREQLEEARRETQEAAEALENEQLDEAVNAGTRAERQFDRMADQFRERTANRFADEMRGARQAARELAGAQEDIGERLEREAQEQRGEEADPFDDAPGGEEVARELKEQQERLEELLKNLRELSEQAEEGEPLLAGKLY
ncbi:MAG: hypothetical protein HKO57_17320, partial [Akkermansiaceae bacterium]|nr:hypothetical protein [Akkermansiaceae bacterium]